MMLWQRLLMVWVLMASPTLLLAAAKAEDAGVYYHALAPALVGNYAAGSEGARPGFFKADLSLRVGSALALERVQHHEPLIRDCLVLLFSRQDAGAFAAAADREALRQTALNAIRDLLQAEEGQPLVDDLLFTNLVAQP